MPSSLVPWFPQDSASKDIVASVVAKSSPTVLRNESELRSGVDEAREADDDDSRKALEAPDTIDGETLVPQVCELFSFALELCCSVALCQIND